MKNPISDRWQITYVYRNPSGETRLLNTLAKISGTRSEVIAEARIWVESSPLSPIRIEATPIP